MVIKNSFSQRPYFPFTYSKNREIYICRLAPDTESVELQWLSEAESVEVVLCENGNEKKYRVNNSHSFSIDGLKKNMLYSVYVSDGKYESNIRLFNTGDYHGKVINYIHKDDKQFDQIGSFLGSPSVVRYKGELYVSMDIFTKDEGSMNCTLIFKSSDNGVTWQYLTDIAPCEWGGLFVAQDKLCILGCSGENASAIISVSTDGLNWTIPSLVAFGSSGTRAKYGIIVSPNSKIILNNKLYASYCIGSLGTGVIDCGILICDLNKDITDSTAWTRTNTVTVDHDWGGDPKIKYCEEGNIVEREGQIYCLLRFAHKRALMNKWDGETYKFYKIVDLPVAHCKFVISSRQKDGFYYCIGNDRCYPREKILLLKSPDLEKWEIVQIVDDISDLQSETNGIQYPMFLPEGNDWPMVVRTALNDADSFHNSNSITFNRINIKNDFNS